MRPVKPGGRSTRPFRSLASYNFRVWASGALVSNVGTWMQRTGQDWLVLTQLSHHNAAAVGVVMALQFGPLVLLLPISGYAADRFDRRKLLMITQASMGTLALALGVLTITGLVRLWHVDIFAFLLGCATAFDSPARQTFVAELVGEDDLSNAVALNSTSFNAARMIGPAAAGLLIAAVGTGWVFLINGASFLAVLASLSLLRVRDLHRERRGEGDRASLLEGFRYAWERPDIRTAMIMFFWIGTFGGNFPIFIATMSVSVFHAGSGRFGMLMSMLAIGSVAGALLAAGRERPRAGLLVASAFAFGAAGLLAAMMPLYWLFGAALVLMGFAAQTFSTSANSTVQLSTDRRMRGRVMALYLTIALGGTPLGAPTIGWIADHLGPRWALAIGGMSGFLAAATGVHYLARHRGLTMRWDRRPRVTFEPMRIGARIPPDDLTL